MRPPPSSTLFPYTTLFRSRENAAVARVGLVEYAGRRSRVIDASTCSGHLRSEEHTSELQSRLHLVCRLLLEKKKEVPAAVDGDLHVPLGGPRAIPVAVDPP